MPKSVGTTPATTTSEAPPSKPLDETAWQAWVAKGREQDRQRSAAVLRTVKWVSAIVLFCTAGIWSHVAPYEVVVKTIVVGGAIFVSFRALQSRNYALSGLFGGLAILYNPVIPGFGFSGDLQRAFVAASSLLFIASLAWVSDKGATQ